MKKVRFLIDLYDIKDDKFYNYNDVAEFEVEKAERLFKDGFVDILKEEPTKKAKKTKEKSKKETKEVEKKSTTKAKTTKKTKKEDKEEDKK